MAHYNAGRPHASLGPGVPDGAALVPVSTERRTRDGHCVVAEPILGGVHHEYRLERAAYHDSGPVPNTCGRHQFLPTYSPDFNSFEQAFAKLKAFLRAADGLKLFTVTECGSHVRRCGYRLTVQL